MSIVSVGCVETSVEYYYLPALFYIIVPRFYKINAVGLYCLECAGKMSYLINY
jgi:hypothetical protein